MAWIGAAAVVVGVVLGFVKSGECGSVFQPRDATADAVNAAFGFLPPDCTTALDLTVPVWVLIAGGLVLLVVGLLVAAGQRTAGNDARPSTNAEPSSSA